MDETTFPFRIDGRTKLFLSALAGVLSEHDVRFASSAGGVHAQFQNKGENRTTIDAPLAFTQDGLQMSMPMNAVAKSNPSALAWLRKYHDHLQRSRGESFEAVPQRCSVVVEARTDGQLRYYMTYMVTHEDGSLAQEMPQGKLFATEALFAAPASQQAGSKQAGQRANEPEQAAWITQED